MTEKKRKRKKIPRALVDIVIPVWNRFDILAPCLEAIPEAFGNIPYKIYIVDNGSEIKDSKPFYSALDLSINVIRNSINKGFPKACNQGYRKGSSPLIFFLNSDVILEPMSGDKLVRAMDNPMIGIVGMKLLFPTSEQLIISELDMNIRPAGMVQHVGLNTNIRGEFVHTMIGWSEDNPRVNGVTETLAVTGAALMTRRKILNQTRGFDEIYGMGTYEDIDLCFQVMELRYKIMVDTSAVGTHYVGATAEKYKKSFPLNENYQIFLSKWKEELLHTDWMVL